MRKTPIALLFAVVLCMQASVAYADLVPPGGEGVSECRNKKAGDACENWLIELSGQRKEPGTCVEEKLDHLHFKFRAHLRCVSASVPAGSASVARPPAPAASPSTAPPPAPSASAAPAPAPVAIASSAPVAEPPKSSGCSFHATSEETAFWPWLALVVVAVCRRRVSR